MDEVAAPARKAIMVLKPRPDTGMRMATTIANAHSIVYSAADERHRPLVDRLCDLRHLPLTRGEPNNRRIQEHGGNYADASCDDGK